MTKLTMTLVVLVSCVISIRAQCQTQQESKDPNGALKFFSVGYDYAQKGDYAVAVEMYRTGLKLEPQNQKAHYFLGEALEALGSHQQEALAEYKIARDLDPSSETGILGLARIVQLERAATKPGTIIRDCEFCPELVI